MNQENALAFLKSGKNVFLTGSAGAGKTYVLNQYIKYLKERKIPVAVTASTGIAATHMNGQTIHAWAGIGIKDYISPNYVLKLLEKKYFYEKMDRVKVLIIDEISMLHRRQLDLVDYVLQISKQNTEPFGGIQVVFSGDFFQLPPIGQEGETNRDKFAFMSNAWVDSQPVVCYLKEQHRQDDADLNSILNQIRTQEVSQDTIDTLLETQYNDLNEETSTQLFTHNADVDSLNLMRLNELGSKAKTFKAKTKGNPALVEVLKRSVLTDADLELKKGAQVMFIKNNYEQGYFNGTLGEVVYFTDKGFPMVELRSRQHLEVKPEKWAIADDEGKDLAAFEQIPLRLAWAITVHKSQGMTLDAASIDLRRTFEPGQGYVALSRVRNLKGLHLRGLNQTAIEVDGLAFRADARFQELSNYANTEYELDFLKSLWNPFIKQSGGLLNEKEIKKQKEKIEKATFKGAKKSTYETTKDYLLKGMKLEEVADVRGLQVATIASHLETIKERFKEVDLEPFRPEATEMHKIEEACKKLKKKKQEVNKKNVYDYFKGKLAYHEITLGLLFLDSSIKETAE